MGCKSALYSATTTAQSVVTGNTIGFGSVIRRYGCQCNLVGGNAVARGLGYYQIIANFIVDASATGTNSIQLYKDGVAIPGAVSTMSVVDGTYQMSISAMVRNFTDCSSTITAIFSGVNSSISSASVSLLKL